MSLLRGFDAVNPDELPGGGLFYPCYVDGWPNVTTVTARFPDAAHPTLTTGFGPADMIDCENGNISWDDGPNSAAIVTWLNSRRDTGVYRPGVYIQSSSAQQLIDGLAERGWARADWRLNAAHWTGVAHLCAPWTCGEPASDCTQWAGMIGGPWGYDADMCLPSFLDTAPAPPPAPAVVPVREATNTIERIPTNSGLAPSQSKNTGAFELVMQAADGNLVLYEHTTKGPVAVWSSRTEGHPGASLEVQDDGDMVIYAADRTALWATETGGRGPVFLSVYPTGQLKLWTGQAPAPGQNVIWSAP